jgi:hypothetical protein
MLRLFQAALAEARERMVELRQTNWETFVRGLNSHTPLSRAWKDINKIKGKNAAEISYPNPLHRANELVDAWATTSSFDSLPLPSQNELNDRYTDRARLLDFMLHQEDDCDMLFTEYELDSALHKGKATSPGEDGVTDGILHMLLLVPGNTFLQLYNMSYVTGELPKSWTNSVIIPIPKPHQPSAFRPISLTSCLYKCLERMVLNRLLYKIINMLSPQIYGFMHGKSVHHCITTFLTLHTDRSYTTFLDLKSAFDIANPHVILRELAKMNVGMLMLKIVQTEINI